MSAVVVLLVVLLTAHILGDPLFSPDSRYYLTMAYRDLGYSPEEALRTQQRVTGIPAEAWYFAGSDPVWHMVQPRLLYPLLSVPFVWLAGPRAGMVVVPALAVLVTVIAVARLAQRLYGPAAAFVAAGALATSATVTGAAVALTDPLAMALVALTLLNLPIRRRTRARNLAWLGILSAALCMTRQVTPMVLGMMAAGSLWSMFSVRLGTSAGRGERRWLAPTVVVTVITLAGQAVCEWVSPYRATDQFLLASHRSSVAAALACLPEMFWRITRAELEVMARTDPNLTALTILSVLFVVLSARAIESWLFVGALLGTYVLMLANGIPSFLRYESVDFPLASLCLAALTHRWLSEPPQRYPDFREVSDSWRRDTWWRPLALAATGAAACAGAIGWSATHGSASLAGAVPTSPAAAAAAADQHWGVLPVARPSAEDVLRDAVGRAVQAYDGGDVRGLVAYFDWRHPLRYMPAGPGFPGWSGRSPDGSAVIRYGDYLELEPTQVAAGLSRFGSFVPPSLTVSSARVDEYGEDVTFTIADRWGHMHRGRATVLYPTRLVSPATITELVYES